MGTMYRAAILVALALALLPATASADTRTVTVAGTATVEVANDKASFSISAEALRRTAASAQAVASKRMARLLRAIKAHGVAETDMRTRQISVFETLLPPAKKGGKPIKAFRALNRTSITSHDVAGLGALYEMVYRLGASDVTSPTFGIAQISGAYRDAFVEALTVAVQKAQAVVGSAGGVLGKPLSVTEGKTSSERAAPMSDRTVYRTYRKRVGKKVRTIREPVEIPVQGGTVAISATVDIVFELL